MSQILHFLYNFWAKNAVGATFFSSDTWGPIYGSECLKLQDLCADFTDVTLADEDTNSIQTDNANRAMQGNVAKQVMQPGGQPMQVLPLGI